jgi:hypothetical protein
MDNNNNGNNNGNIILDEYVPMELEDNETNANLNLNLNVNLNDELNMNANLNLLNNNNRRGPTRTINDVIFEMGIRNLHRYDCFINIANEHNITGGVADTAYFHALCAGGNVHEIEHWISNYINIHGYNNFVEFANRPLYNDVIGYNITPMVTAVLWNSVGVLRLLYSFGLRLDQVDGFYPEETILHFPFVHPIAHLFPANVMAQILGYNENLNFNFRRLDEFTDIINEIRYISGELLPPVGWQPVAARFR